MVAPRSTCPVSVAIPTYRRMAQLGDTLARIQSCDPAPAEIIVHVDAGDEDTGSYLAAAFPDVRVLSSSVRAGPGGGRNKLVAAASHELVASFDDDSYPLDGDYFARVCRLFAMLPDVAVIASRITDKGNPIADARAEVGPTVHFGGGGVAYRRADFIASGGYVALAVAYGMEEVDLCIRLIAMGKKIHATRWLRVFHDNDLSGHAAAPVTSASIANLALLVFLRYPLRFWPYGALQVANRIAWLLKMGRVSGVATGIARIPGHLWRHRGLRAPVSPSALSLFLRARRAPVQYRALDL